MKRMFCVAGLVYKPDRPLPFPFIQDIIALNFIHAIDIAKRMFGEDKIKDIQIETVSSDSYGISCHIWYDRGA